jgi:hypothetical protein
MKKKITNRLMKLYARRSGIPVEPLGDLGWIVPTRDPEQIPPISITEFNGNVLFNVLPVVTLSNRNKRPAVMQRLLELNARHPLVCYALEVDWQVLLWTVYPVELFSYALFETGVGAIQQALSEDLPALRKMLGK